MLTLPIRQNLLRITIGILSLLNLYSKDLTTSPELIFVSCVGLIICGLHFIKDKKWIGLFFTFWLIIQVVVFQSFNFGWDTNQLLDLKWYLTYKFSDFYIGINLPVLILLILHIKFSNNQIIGKKISISTLKNDIGFTKFKGVITEVVEVENEKWLKVRLDDEALLGKKYPFSSLLIQLKEGESLHKDRTSLVSVKTLDSASDKYRFLDWAKVSIVM